MSHLGAGMLDSNDFIPRTRMFTVASNTRVTSRYLVTRSYIWYQLSFQLVLLITQSPRAYFLRCFCSVLFP